MMRGQLFRRLRYWLRRDELDAALTEELEFHRQLKQQAFERDGMSPTDAHHAARRELGNVTQAREAARHVWIWPWIDSVRQDVGYAVRSLRRQPGFTCLSVVVLGIAVGLNASLFTVAAGIALRPMAGLSDAGRVVTVAGAIPAAVGGVGGMSFPEFAFLAAGSRTLTGLAAERNTSVTLDAGGVGRTTVVHAVTASYFDVLGVRMARGRGFRSEEDRRDAPEPVVVLSYALWQTRLGADPATVGTTVRLNDTPHTVVGITPQEFTGSEGGAIRIWVPLSSLPRLRPNNPFEVNLLDRAEDCCVDVVGRLADAVTRGQAEAELQVLSDRFRSSVAQDPRPIVLEGTAFLRGRRADAGTVLAVIGVLFLGIVIVLLLACANVGNLLLARAVARRGEIGVRLAIGASRRRIVRQLLTEGFVLALIASAVGVVLAWWLPGIALNRLAGHPAPFDTNPDGLVIAYAVFLAAVACVAFALAPALHATRGNVAGALKDAAPSPSTLPLRSMLLAAQVAMTIVLLASAGLLLRGVAAARTVDLGFAIDDVVVAAIELPQPAYDAARSETFMTDLAAGLRDAGVDSFAFVSTEPLSENSYMTGLRLTGEGVDQARSIEFRAVTPGYFDVLRIPVAAGRAFVDADAGRGVAIVNETLARRYWPGENPLGRSFVTGEERSLQIIGVVGDAHIDGLAAVEPMFFQPMTRLRSDRLPRLLFASTRPSTSAAVIAAIERLERRARVEVVPLSDRLESWLGELTLAPIAAALLGMFGLGLATVGMFGVFAFVVRQRTREIGIRMALGARPADVVRIVLAGNSRAVIAGLGVGIAGAVAASQVLRSSLYGLSPLDPVTYGTVTVVLAAAALAASYVPARRAARVNPMRALRSE